MNWYNGSEPQDDSDYPQMTNDDVTAMVCKPVAPASVERLEDIVGQRMIDEMLKVKQCPGYSIHTPAWERLFDLKLIDIAITDEDADATIDILTERGAALVADYHRRQAAADEKPHLFKRIQDILDLAGYYLPGELAENPVKVSTDIEEFRNYAAISKKRIEDLEAENARLQAELDAARGEINRALIKILQLKDIIAGKE